MSEYTEGDIKRMQGQVYGFLLAIGRNTRETAFDQAKWEDQYGKRVVYSSVPYYPSKEAQRNDEGGHDMYDWDDETETLYLKQDVEVPDDRPGELVTEDGVVVMLQSGKPAMFELDDADVQLIEKWEDRQKKIVRDVYDVLPH